MVKKGTRYHERERTDDSIIIFYKEDAMVMFGPKLGTWSVHSEKDPRWNKSGRGYGLVTSGGPQEMRDWIEKCKEEFGDPPDDATESFWKD